MVNVENQSTDKVLIEKKLLELFNNDFGGSILLELKEKLDELSLFLVGIFLLDNSDFGRSDFELVIDRNLVIPTIDQSLNNRSVQELDEVGGKGFVGMGLEFGEDVVEMLVRRQADDVVGVAIVFLYGDDVEALNLEFFAPLFHRFDALDFLVGLNQFHHVEFFQGSIEALLKFEAGRVVVCPSVYSELVVFHVLDLKCVLLEFVREGF